MGGKKELPVFHYESEDKGFKYLGKFASRAEVFKMYFDGKYGRLFEEGWDYKRLPDGSYVTRDKVGKEGLRHLIRITEDPTIYKRRDDKLIEITNHIGEVVGTVSNIRVLESIVNSDMSTIRASIRASAKEYSRRYKLYSSWGNLIYKFKRNDND